MQVCHHPISHGELRTNGQDRLKRPLLEVQPRVILTRRAALVEKRQADLKGEDGALLVLKCGRPAHSGFAIDRQRGFVFGRRQEDGVASLSRRRGVADKASGWRGGGGGAACGGANGREVSHAGRQLKLAKLGVQAASPSR